MGAPPGFASRGSPVRSRSAPWYPLSPRHPGCHALPRLAASSARRPGRGLVRTRRMQRRGALAGSGTHGHGGRGAGRHAQGRHAGALAAQVADAADFNPGQRAGEHMDQYGADGRRPAQQPAPRRLRHDRRRDPARRRTRRLDAVSRSARRQATANHRRGSRLAGRHRCGPRLPADPGAPSDQRGFPRRGRRD